MSTKKLKGVFRMEDSTDTSTTGGTLSYLLPLDLEWNPQEDITIYEMAKCLPILLRNRAVMPHEVDKDAPIMRHFKITDLNKYNKHSHKSLN